MVWLKARRHYWFFLTVLLWYCSPACESHVCGCPLSNHHTWLHLHDWILCLRLCLKFKLTFTPNFRFLFTCLDISLCIYWTETPSNGHPTARLDYSASQRATIIWNNSLEKLCLLASLLAGFNRRQEDKTLYIGFIIMDSLYKDPQTPKFLAGSLNCCKSCNRDLVGTTQLSASGSQKKSKELRLMVHS